MNPTDDELAQITAGSTSLADIRRRVYEAGYAAGHTAGRQTSMDEEAFQGDMETTTEYGFQVQGSPRIYPLEAKNYLVQHPEEAFPYIVLSRVVYRDPWDQHVYYPPVPMA